MDDNELNKSDELFKNFDVKCWCVVSHAACVCTYQERVIRTVAGASVASQVFNDEQRELIREETVYQAEGSLSREEAEAMTDVELAGSWLRTLNDYVRGQL